MSSLNATNFKRATKSQKILQFIHYISGQYSAQLILIVVLFVNIPEI